MSNIKTIFENLNLSKTKLELAISIKPSKKLSRELVGVEYQLGMLTSMNPSLLKREAFKAPAKVAELCS